jgi:hypothetical protein
VNLISKFPDTKSLLQRSTRSPKEKMSALASSVGAFIRCSRSAESKEMLSQEYARGSVWWKMRLSGVLDID